MLEVTIARLAAPAILEITAIALARLCAFPELQDVRRLEPLFEQNQEGLITEVAYREVGVTFVVVTGELGRQQHDIAVPCDSRTGINRLLFAFPA